MYFLLLLKYHGFDVYDVKSKSSTVVVSSKQLLSVDAVTPVTTAITTVTREKRTKVVIVFILVFIM